MPVIVILAAEEKDRKELSLSVGELGHRAVQVSDLMGALEAVRAERPKLIIVVQTASGTMADSLLAELEREAPMLPVVVAMTERKASRAVELMKAGVFDVVAPPWTPEGLSACLSKALRFRGTALSVAPQEEAPRGALQYLLIALVVLGIALGFAALRKRRELARLAERPVPKTSWEVPYSHPGGLAVHGGELWITDWYSQSLYRHSLADLRVVRTIHFPREIPGALAFGGDALWVAAAPRSIVKHMLDDRLGVLGWFPDSVPQTVGMAYDGLYLWTCDRATGRLHKRIPDESLSVVESYAYGSGRPAALAFDGKTLWSVDVVNRELLRHDLADPSRVTLRLPLPEYRSGEWAPVGLAFDGDKFWTVAERRPKGEGAGRLFVHPLPPAQP